MVEKGKTVDIIEKFVIIECLANELLVYSVNAIEEIKADASGHYMSKLQKKIPKTVHSGCPTISRILSNHLIWFGSFIC